MEPIFALLLLTALISCGHVREKTAIKADSSKYKKIAERAKDSLFLEQSLADALSMARHHKGQNRFADSAGASMPDSSDSVTVALRQDYFFSNETPHLIVWRKGSYWTYIDIFTTNNFEKVVSYKLFSNTYVNDTIYDVNGDGFKDFVVNAYGNSGCCMKAEEDVFLQTAGKTSFSSDFEFLNATFSPREGIVRGVDYGQPGETDMYKYKWHGQGLDTIEYISYERDDKNKKTGRFVITNKDPYENDAKVLRVVNTIPREYREIDGYDWFTGNI
jgi:hypothetical protein